MSDDLLEAVICRLRETVPALACVAGASELSQLLSDEVLPQSTPAGFVLEMEQQASPNSLAAGGFRQTLLITLGVALVHRVDNDASGMALRRVLRPLKKAVQDSLLGWVPRADCSALTLQRASLTLGQGAGLELITFSLTTQIHYQEQES